jgi:hypothetical protein
VGVDQTRSDERPLQIFLHPAFVAGADAGDAPLPQGDFSRLQFAGKNVGQREIAQDKIGRGIAAGDGQQLWVGPGVEHAR